MKTKHSPTPWTVVDKSVNANDWDTSQKLIAHLDNVQIWGPVERGGSYAENIANAHHIVKCVNSHYETLQALKIAHMLFLESFGMVSDTIKKL